MRHRNGSIANAIVLLLAVGVPSFAQPAGTAFTYQGRLSDNGTAVTGPFDFQCVLYTAASGGTQVGPTVAPNDVAVANGLFTVNLDFGAAAFAGSARFLQIGVRPGASTGTYTTLGARQEIKPAPHTVFAQTAPWAGLTGVPAGFADGVDNDSGGDITGVTVGTGLTGGGATGAVSIGIDYPTLTLNHNHSGQVWNASSASGLHVNNTAVNGVGLRGAAMATTGAGTGLLGTSATGGGVAVEGTNSGATGLGIGVRGVTQSSSGRAVYGLALATPGNPVGVMGETSAPGGYGVRGDATAATGASVGVFGTTVSNNGAGVMGESLASSGSTAGVWGRYHSSNGGAAVIGQSLNTVGSGAGVFAYVQSTAATAVFAVAPTGAQAGYFSANVEISGTLSKAAGSFKIDHPLDPENKYLYHSFVESPEMMNVYAGNVVTDGDGLATVTMPDWFEALNRDFRYQLTVLDEGDSAVFVQAKVVRKIAGNRFTIRTSAPRVEVSWLVAGVRHDAYAEAHRIPVEEWKPDDRRGRYVHPDAWGRAKERAEDWDKQQQLTRAPDLASPPPVQ